MLEELRKKPKYLRRNYAFWGASIITLFIIVIWSIALLVSFEKTDAISSNEQGEKVQGAFSNFLVDFMERVNSVWQNEKNLTKPGSNTSSNEDSRVHSSSTKVENTTEQSTFQASTTNSRHIKIATSSSATQ